MLKYTNSSLYEYVTDILIRLVVVFQKAGAKIRIRHARDLLVGMLREEGVQGG
jgi:hypothetical protein